MHCTRMRPRQTQLTKPHVAERNREDESGFVGFWHRIPLSAGTEWMQHGFVSGGRRRREEKTERAEQARHTHHTGRSAEDPRDHIAVPTAATASRDRTDICFKKIFFRCGIPCQLDSQRCSLQPWNERKDDEEADSGERASSETRRRRRLGALSPAGGELIRTREAGGRPAKPHERRQNLGTARRRLRQRRWRSEQRLQFVCQHFDWGHKDFRDTQSQQDRSHQWQNQEPL